MQKIESIIQLLNLKSEYKADFKLQKHKNTAVDETFKSNKSGNVAKINTHFSWKNKKIF